MVTSRAVVLVLRKKELKHEYWTRLTKEKPNRNWVKCDFSKVSYSPFLLDDCKLTF
jgi:hypothetical protein